MRMCFTRAAGFYTTMNLAVTMNIKHTPFDAQLLQSDGHMAIWPEARCQRDLAPAGHGLPRHALARSGRGANAQGAAVQRQPLLCQRGSRAGPLCIDILHDVEAA
jgi:hypothetical protein